GSGIDYLYQGALWFGACKQRRNDFGDKLYWQDAAQETTGTTNMGFGRVIDTLVSVGFDGDADMYEFLPAYNQLEEIALGSMYDVYNLKDGIIEASIRTQKAGVDDDGDGKIDEDPAGFAFPYRSTVPSQFSTFLPGINEFRNVVDSTRCEPEEIIENVDIWFPLGFLKLGYDDPDSIYNFAQAQDDDNDGLRDEDGYPISEQDYLGYYYDYSPFGTPGERIWGGWTFGQGHTPLNIRVRQVSFQWSYEYIKNLVYIEFDITNMNSIDTLFDCAMGIYMDCDVGPQSWGADPRSMDDISSYVSGKGYEFAYTYDADQDGGLTTGYIGARVCTPDPDKLEFACWTWDRGHGPYDESSREYNEKYWLLTDRNPKDEWYTSLREDPGAQLNEPCDTRYLFAFYGDMKGFTAETDSSWNLKPYETMKIVIAVFPGDDVEELKRTAVWSKTLYGEAQTLTTVVLPDTFKHYEAPGPPDIPNLTLDQSLDGDTVFVYWDNRSEFTVDIMTLTREFVGWQNTIPYLDSYIDKYDEQVVQYGPFPDDFVPKYDSQGQLIQNTNAKVNPWTGFRLRHDFQGYTLWKASNSGEQDAYMEWDRWDKVDTPQDMRDYDVCMNLPVDSMNVYYGGQLGINNGLPMEYIVGTDPADDIIYTADSTVYWTDYYQLDSLYSFVDIAAGNKVHGIPLYNVLDSADVDPIYAPPPPLTEKEKQENALLFKNPLIDDELYLDLYDDKLIPLPGHLGQAHPEGLLELKKNRLSRRYYISEILYPEKGVENYIAVTSFDRGIPSQNLQALESGKDGNRITIFAGPSAASNLENVYVVPNPYLGQSKFDGRRDKDETGDRSKRIWFVNLPEKCTIRIYTLAGDLVDEIEHHGTSVVDVINPSKATHTGIAQSGTEPWDLLSKHDQIIASGVYLYSVEDHATGNVKVNKLVLIK
ncbi:MAG: hypothetical protein H8E22_00100, partial [Candidatus Cloacimonetes bacterium]|nr:hypothetical protein [Candidatus Cloacimonadota bacterium]